jgi:acetyl esterase/lipase
MKLTISGRTAYLDPDAATDKIEAYSAAAWVENVGLSSLYIDCGQLDIFVHENVEYASRFVVANIPTECHIYPGLPHGFEVFAPLSVTQQAVANRDRAVMSF